MCSLCLTEKSGQRHSIFLIISTEEEPPAAVIVNTGNMSVDESNDLCYKGQDLLELARNTIHCLKYISENYYFGITILISVLRGVEREKIVKHKLNEVPEYGIYANMSEDDMRAVVQWLINNHYMLKTKAQYPVLHPTYDGNHFDDCITKKQIKDFKKYLENRNKEIFEDKDLEK